MNRVRSHRFLKTLTLCTTLCLALAACDDGGAEEDPLDDLFDDERAVETDGGPIERADAAADAGPDPVPGPERCGDGALDPGETCDPGRPAQPCAAYDPRYISGAARCADDCSLDLSDCRRPGVCGDGQLDAGEDCDDGNTADRDGCSAICTDEQPGRHAENDTQPDAHGGGGRSGDAAEAGECADPQTRDAYAPGETVAVRVRLHVIRQWSPGGGEVFTASRDEAFEIVDVANGLLEESGILLVPQPDLDVIDDRDGLFFNLYSGNNWRLWRTRNDPSAVDVYYVNSSFDDEGTFCGWSPLGFEFGHDGMIVVRGCGGDTLAHEIGHQFGLRHTFDVDDEGADCSETGDLLCDTPEDPGVDVCTNPGHRGDCEVCEWNNPACRPTCPDGQTPDPFNLMSYYTCGSFDASTGRLTVQQAARMRCHLDKQFRYATGAVCVDADFDGYGEADGPGCRERGVDCADDDHDVSPGAQESCNGIDDDCDGAIDEGSHERCGEDTGLCGQGVRYCEDGRLSDVCRHEIEPQAESCNGLDDDCDGAVDEDVDPLSDAVADRCPSMGICAGGAARQRCVAGEWICDLPRGYVEEECATISPVCGHGDLEDPTCGDGRDNDCDGVRDEHDPIRVCAEDPLFGDIGTECFASPHGRCRAAGGAYQCGQLAEGCGVRVDCVGAVFPEAERCDQQDWDCDGHVANRNDLDNDGYGDCAGRLDCDERRRDVHPGAPEACDGADNDCDGQTDEGFAIESCGIGQCRREVRTCDGGRLVACQPGLPGVEACNRLDDDCDGQIDEGEACVRQVDLVDRIEVRDLVHTRGDTDTHGDGPRMTTTLDFQRWDDRIVAVACVTSAELGPDYTTGSRCVETVVYRGQVAAILDDHGFMAEYIDTDHDWDNAFSEAHERRAHPAVVTVSCLGDTGHADICADDDCSRCIFNLGSLRVRVNP